MTEQPPIVLVHGAWHGAWCWDDLVAELRGRGREVVAFDLPGHDHPGDHRRIWSTAGSYVKALDAVVRAQSRPPLLVGHSMGGYVVRRYLGKGSPSVVGAVLLAPMPRRGVLPTTFRLIRRDPIPTLRCLFTATLWPVMADAKDRREVLLGPNPAPEVETLLTAKLQNESYVAFLALSIPLPSPSRAKAPVQVVAGTADHVFTLAQQRDLAQAYGTPLVELPDIGHDVMFEVPIEQLADLIEAWPPAS